MRRALVGAALFVAAGLGLAWAASRPADLSAQTRSVLATHTADAARGEGIFWAAGCSGCHAAPGLAFDAPPEARLALGGGRQFVTDFGTFHAPNVSMHPVEGIGAWGLEDFARALMLGVSPEGTHYYPALPYTTYARADSRDIADLWAFWQTLPAIDTPSVPHAVTFPFSLRRGIGLWKRLNLDPAFITPPATDPVVARGRYLVEALGHCGECHTPRDRIGGAQRDQWLAGAANPSGPGRIPALPPSGWSAFDIEAYLFSGFTPSFDVVGGSMADVVVHMARLPAEDRQAIAAYLLALPARP